MSGLSGNKKIIISVAAFILVIAVVIVILLFARGGDEKPEDPTGDSSVTTTEISGFEDSSEITSNIEGNQSDTPAGNQSETTTNAAQPGTSDDNTSTTAVNTSKPTETLEERQIKAINAYIAGSYYISASLEADGDSVDLDMAIKGKDFHTSIAVDGMNLSLIYLGGDIYFVNEDTGKYVEMSKMIMKQLGLDLSEMEDMTASINLSSYNFTDRKKTAVQLNGKSADCYEYFTDTASVRFYFIGDDMRRIEFMDENGNVLSTMEVNDYSAEIPSHMLNLSAYEKSNLIEFFMGMAF